MSTPGKKRALALTTGLGLAGAAAASILAAWQRNAPRTLEGGSGWSARLEPGEPRRVGVVLNPVKHRADQARQLVRHAAAESGWEEPRFYETTVEDPGVSQARQALADGCEIVVAAGGDGTVRKVASVLEDTEAAMGLIPLGTGNLLARNLRLPVNDLTVCVASALFGTVRMIDLIRITGTLEEGGSTGTTFLVMGGAGFDAQIMTDTREDLKSRWGWVAYVEAGLRNLVSVRHPMVLRIDGGAPIRRKTRAVLVANTGELQAGIRLAEDSTLDDQHLEAILLTPRNLLAWVALVGQVLTRRRRGPRVIEHFGGSSVEVDFLDHPQPLEVDGDPIGTVTHFEAHVCPAALAVNTHPENLSPFRSLVNLRADLHSRAQEGLQRLGWGPGRAA